MCVKVKVEKRFKEVKTESYTLEQVRQLMQGKGGRELPQWRENLLPNIIPA